MGYEVEDAVAGVQMIPNQGVLISTLPLLEAKASSEIENVVTTADKLFQALPNDSNADPATREALRYREALLAGSLWAVAALLVWLGGRRFGRAQIMARV